MMSRAWDFRGVGLAIPHMLPLRLRTQDPIYTRKVDGASLAARIVARCVCGLFGRVALGWRCTSGAAALIELETIGDARRRGSSGSRGAEAGPPSDTTTVGARSSLANPEFSQAVAPSVDGDHSDIPPSLCAPPTDEAADGKCDEAHDCDRCRSWR